jgi:hypothetical protein
MAKMSNRWLLGLLGPVSPTFLSFVPDLSMPSVLMFGWLVLNQVIDCACLPGCTDLEWFYLAISPSVGLYFAKPSKAFIFVCCLQCVS